jgi:hypothetical protein
MRKAKTDPIYEEVEIYEADWMQLNCQIAAVYVTIRDSRKPNDQTEVLQRIGSTRYFVQSFSHTPRIYSRKRGY